jgi:eukaryotic-like serine/threonine-protein kinase
MSVQSSRLPHGLPRQDVDDEDGLPVWVFAESEEIVPGMRAMSALGVGVRCETWLAWSTHLWAPVVVKLPRPHQVEHPRATAALGREVTGLAGTGHPALPRVWRDGRDEALPHVVIEYVDGPTVADVVDELGPMAEADVAQLGVQLLPAVMTLHERGLAHLDLKAENVVLRDGRPVLIDLGSSRAIGSVQPEGQPVGTLGYAAPEMEACAPITTQMDLFSLGAVLAEALTGAPFADHGPLPPTALSDLVRRLLADDPSQRGTPQKALLDLAAACAERPWPRWASRLL